MIGMNFISFLILLIISIVVSGILHYGFKYYATAGFEVVLRQGRCGLVRRVARIASLRLLASSIPDSQLPEHLDYPRNSGGDRGSWVGG